MITVEESVTGEYVLAGDDYCDYFFEKLSDNKVRLEKVTDKLGSKVDKCVTPPEAYEKVESEGYTIIG